LIPDPVKTNIYWYWIQDVKVLVFPEPENYAGFPAKSIATSEPIARTTTYLNKYQHPMLLIAY
jgi:hypothetical protein